MLNYDEMVECGQKYAFEKKEMLIKKYEAFIDYIKKVILLTFRDNEKQVISYLEKTDNLSFLIDWCVRDIHYDGFVIKLIDGKINVDSLVAHDSYYDPVLKLESNINKYELSSFFDNEYKNFKNLFTPYCVDGYIIDEPVDKDHSLVYNIAEKFNNVCFRKFKEYFSSLDINDEQSFMKSKFSLSFTDEQRHELDKEVYAYYDSFDEKLTEITKHFEESVKDLK